MARVLQRGDKIFLTRALEFLLGCFEVGDASDDLFPLERGVVRLFDHAHPFDSCPASIGDRNWGANWEMVVQDCDRLDRTAFAVRGG